MNTKQESKLKTIIELIKQGCMELPQSTENLERVIRSVVDNGVETPNKSNFYGEKLPLSTNNFMLKSISTITGKIKDGKPEYLSKVKDAMTRLNYFNKSVDDGVMGTFDFDETFDLVIKNMIKLNVIEVFENKLMLKKK